MQKVHLSMNLCFSKASLIYVTGRNQLYETWLKNIFLEDLEYYALGRSCTQDVIDGPIIYFDLRPGYKTF